LVYAAVTIEGFNIRQNSTNVDQNHNTMAILLEAAGGSIIRNCRIEHHITGIYISGSKNNLIEDNIITNCGNGVLFAAFAFDADDNTIRDNRIANNGISSEQDDAGVKLITNYDGIGNQITENDIEANTIGINNLTPNTINAMGNWWGDPSGPSNPSNPTGAGNSVSGFVMFENWSLSTNNVVLAVSPPTSEKLEDVNLYPNPAREAAWLAYGLKQEAAVSLTMVDVHGRNVFSESQGQQLPGNYQVALPIPALTPGFYVINLTIDGVSNLSKLVIH
ncbi:MAG: right-handed parallel beta-helix repeat-containing protein, partial [Bacteroidota bacterium]